MTKTSKNGSVPSACVSSAVNCMDSSIESIQFTAEDTHADGTLPFLDVLVIPQPDGSLATTVYRKPTHIHFHRVEKICG